MSRQFINEYRAELDRLHAVSGSRREGVLSEAFKDLLKRWGKSQDSVFNAQHEQSPRAADDLSLIARCMTHLLLRQSVGTSDSAKRGK